MNYQSLLTPTPPLWACEDSSYQYRVMTERHLQAIWFEQKYFKTLVTATGKRIEVISPGIWNFDAGPDFLKAHLRIGGQELRGDVEIHLSDENWTEHGHHLDERYNDVILHVSLWEPKKEIYVSTLIGQEVEQTYFEKAFTTSETIILQKIDLDLYPYKKFVGSGKCAHSVYKDLSRDNALQLFGGAAEWRLNQKFKYLERQIKTPNWQFIVGFAMALGYKRNTDAFLNLFLQLFNTLIKDKEELLAIGLQSCGFFSERYREKWKDSSYYNRLLGMSTGPIKHHTKLVLHQIRPMNHPIRRLVVMTKLLSDPSMPRLYSRLLMYWQLRWRRSMYQNTWLKFLARMRRILPNFKDPYWNTHFTFEKEESEKRISMIGDSLKTEIIVNSFMPLLWEHIKNTGKKRMEVRAFFDFYNSIPFSNTGKTRYLTHRFYGDTPKGSVLQNAMTEQGAYQLHKDFCIHYEASCEGCPFVDRVESGMKARMFNKSPLPIHSHYRKRSKHPQKASKTRGLYLTRGRKKPTPYHVNSKLILTLGRSSRKMHVHFQWG